MKQQQHLGAVLYLLQILNAGYTLKVFLNYRTTQSISNVEQCKQLCLQSYQTVFGRVLHISKTFWKLFFLFCGYKFSILGLFQKKSFFTFFYHKPEGQMECPGGPNLARGPLVGKHCTRGYVRDHPKWHKFLSKCGKINVFSE